MRPICPISIKIDFNTLCWGPNSQITENRFQVLSRGGSIKIDFNTLCRGPNSKSIKIDSKCRHEADQLKSILIPSPGVPIANSIKIDSKCFRTQNLWTRVLKLISSHWQEKN